MPSFPTCLHLFPSRKGHLMPRRLILSFAAAAAVVALGAAGCSASSDSNSATSTTAAPISTAPPPTNPNTEAGLIGAATDYLNWGDTNDAGKQYVVLSARCVAKWPTPESWKANVAAATKILDNLGFSAEGATVESVTVSDLGGDKATVHAVVKTADGKTIDALATSNWVYENGGWRSDSCDASM
jgi:hypothetical protein